MPTPPVVRHYRPEFSSWCVAPELKPTPLLSPRQSLCGASTVLPAVAASPGGGYTAPASPLRPRRPGNNFARLVTPFIISHRRAQHPSYQRQFGALSAHGCFTRGRPGRTLSSQSINQILSNVHQYYGTAGPRNLWWRPLLAAPAQPPRLSRFWDHGQPTLSTGMP
ncbi:uncharacterized protein B0I36DRAFT_334171 [Microdochium trichocladiopsis]|uniref:Uncharacterized protein n=1 Tax=Microdochium trichocladiopsis TaxID=1682393 RepID=A0A9P8XWN3_9PEZI|nr:uncharacterized protein B0I36DRAFT_334171 [Microdochium trichocladiopsis]KAH7021276.1 hypothetical protein B0I36DRAFT_334171 [Microdochium trichocladiopsis]